MEETISTLKFATRMMRLTTSAIVNVQPDTNVLLKQYEREIVQLKKRLAKVIDQLNLISSSTERIDFSVI